MLSTSYLSLQMLDVWKGIVAATIYIGIISCNFREILGFTLKRLSSGLDGRKAEIQAAFGKFGGHLLAGIIGKKSGVSKTRYLNLVLHKSIAG